MYTKPTAVAAATLSLLLSTTAAASSLPHHVVAQFPNPTWLENIAVRSNGDLVVTQLEPNASLFRISSPSSASPVVELAWSADADTLSGLLGIAELGAGSDVFAFVGLHADAAGTFAGTDGIWIADFSGTSGDDDDDEGVDVRHVVDIEESGVLNGLAVVPCATNLVLVADSWVGVVWRVDVSTGAYEKAIQVSEMAPANASDPSSLGVNGIKIHDKHLYWTNSAARTIYRLAITSQGLARADAVVETVASLDASFVDDFAISADGKTIFAATNDDNSLVAIDVATGQSVTVLGSEGSLTLAGGTSVAFGHGGCEGTVYVATCGGLSAPVNGTITEGGKVVAVDVRGFSF